MHPFIPYMRKPTNHGRVESSVANVSKHGPPEQQMSAGLRRVSGELHASDSTNWSIILVACGKQLQATI